MLSKAEEAMLVAFRPSTLLPLDGCLSALQPTIAHLTWSARHGCRRRHSISRLPEVEGDKPQATALQARSDRLPAYRHGRGADPHREGEEQAELRRHGIRISMSDKGNCCDDARVETFFKTLKAELVWRAAFRSRTEAAAAIGR